MPRRNSILITIAMGGMLAACASPNPVAYKGLASSQYMTANPPVTGGRVIDVYSKPIDWRAYDKVIIAPVVVYHGPDNQFGNLPEESKQELARYMQLLFSQKLAQRFQLSVKPAPRTLEVKLTLTGAKETTAFLASAAKIDMAGAVYNGIQSVRGGEGAFTGSVIYSVEIYDAATSKLVDAKIIKQYPNSYNIGASFGALTAAKVGLQKGADELVERFK
ncbi:lipoprotein [Labrys miyagiensis]